MGKSDHSLIKVVYRSQPMSSPRKLVCCYEKADFKKMRREFDIDWESYCQDCENDIDKTWNKFQTKFAEAEKLYVPKKVVKTNIKRISIPLDRKALSKRKKKYRLWKRYLQTKDAKVEYCRCRNQLRRLTRQAVKSKEKNIANQVKSNIKQLWRYINTKTKLRPTIPELYTTIVTDPSKMTNNGSEKAEVLGKFFSSVYTRESEWTWVLNDEDKPNKVR